MTNEDLQDEIAGLWNDLREDDQMLVDAPAAKVGMPYALPYGCVCIPVEQDGVFMTVEVPHTEVTRLVHGLLKEAVLAKELEEGFVAEYDAHVAIEKARESRV